jgi:hypothetical protein
MRLFLKHFFYVASLTVTCVAWLMDFQLDRGSDRAFSLINYEMMDISKMQQSHDLEKYQRPDGAPMEWHLTPDGTRLAIITSGTAINTVYYSTRHAYRTVADLYTCAMIFFAAAIVMSWISRNSAQGAKRS